MKAKGRSSQFHNRLWLLLVLPHLLWNIVGSTPHLHAPNGSEISWWNVGSVTLQQHAQSSTRSHQQSWEASAHTHFAAQNGPCLLCQWGSQSSSVSSVARLVAAFAEQCAAFATISPFHISRVIHNAANRGPPLS